MVLNTRGAPVRMLLQRLGYMPAISHGPPAIVECVRCLGVRRCIALPSRATTARQQVPEPENSLRVCPDSPLDGTIHAWLADTPHMRPDLAELPDIINVMLEKLVRRRYQLLSLARLTPIASQTPSQLHESIYPPRQPLDDDLPVSTRCL